MKTSQARQAGLERRARGARRSPQGAELGSSRRMGAQAGVQGNGEPGGPSGRTWRRGRTPVARARACSRGGEGSARGAQVRQEGLGLVAGAMRNRPAGEGQKEQVAAAPLIDPKGYRGHRVV